MRSAGLRKCRQKPSPPWRRSTGNTRTRRLHPANPGPPQRRQPPPPVPSPVEQLKDLGQQVLPAVEDVLEGGSIADLINAFLPQDDDSAVGGVLKALKLDGEKILILGLLLFLMNAKADKTILLALFYLLF